VHTKAGRGDSVYTPGWKEKKKPRPAILVPAERIKGNNEAQPFQKMGRDATQKTRGEPKWGEVAGKMQSQRSINFWPKIKENRTDKEPLQREKKTAKWVPIKSHQGIIGKRGGPQRDHKSARNQGARQG